MKKVNKIITVAFLFSSILLSPISSVVRAEDIEHAEITEIKPTIEHQEATETEPVIENEEATKIEPIIENEGAIETKPVIGNQIAEQAEQIDSNEERNQAIEVLQIKLAQLKSYTQFLTVLEDRISFAEMILADPSASLEDINFSIFDIDDALTVLKSGIPEDKEIAIELLKVKLEEVKSYLNYEVIAGLNVSIAEYVISSYPWQTVEDINFRIKELENTITQLKKLPTLEVANKTMYVGDYFDTETLLNWVIVTNELELPISIEYEILNGPILIDSETNKLNKTGSYAIRYTLKYSNRHPGYPYPGHPIYLMNEEVPDPVPNNSYEITSDMVLTVLDKSTPVVPTVPTTPVAPSTPVQTKEIIKLKENITTVNNKQVNNVNEKKLPQTGENNLSHMTTLLGVFILAISYIMVNRKFKNKRYTNY